MGEVSKELVDLYKTSAFLVSLKRNKFPKNWIVTIRDEPGFIFLQKAFFFKKNAINFIVKELDDIHS